MPIRKKSGNLFKDPRTLLFNAAHILLTWILSLLISDFKLRGLRIFIPLTVTLIEFFLVDTDTDIHPLLGPLYFRSSFN